MAETKSISLSEFNRRIASAVNSAPDINSVWVVAETSDVRVAGGHCYLELVEKDQRGRQIAKIRAIIWQNVYYKLAARFRMETGEDFRSDIRVMVLVTATFHPVFGLSAMITDIDCAVTLGERLRRRAEMLKRLNDEGIIDMNRSLDFPAVPQRVAVISARGAAGYGDFLRHLIDNPSHIRFSVDLFEATMQGDRTAPSIIAALDAINSIADRYDTVVIIRGGGATTDLLAFDDYDLAANIAQFPLPVIIGIGHERDTTLLDYVARMRVKTPTAAAAFLVERADDMLSNIQGTANAIFQTALQRIAGCHRQIETYTGMLPGTVRAALANARKHLEKALLALGSASDRRIRPGLVHLAGIARSLACAVRFAIERQRQRIAATETLVDALSPAATLRRGYSITRVDGHAVSSTEKVAAGSTIETILAQGIIHSTVITIKNPEDEKC